MTWEQIQQNNVSVPEVARIWKTFHLD